MFFKKIAHWWASSKLEKQEAQTQSLIHELDRQKSAANTRIQFKKDDFSIKIKSHQEKRNEQLKAHIDFMNEQLHITADYLPKLNQFQSQTFTCVDSWMQLDLCQQEIDIVNQKINATVTTISLFDRYISELDNSSQRQERLAWRELTAERKLTFSNDFCDKTIDRINRTLKSNNDEFKSEIKRLQSHRNALYKELGIMRADRTDIMKKKNAAIEKHNENKNLLNEKYNLCLEHWKSIAKKFEAYYAYQFSDLEYVNEWLGELEEGGTLPEITKVIREKNDIVECAKVAFQELADEYEPYKRRVKEAHDSKEYPDTFANDNAQRKRLAPLVTAALDKKKALVKARSFLYTRRNELRGYIERIKPLHPEAAIDAICEILSSDGEFNAWIAFGINTSKQKRAHWERMQHRIENAATN